MPVGTAFGRPGIECMDQGAAARLGACIKCHDSNRGGELVRARKTNTLRTLQRPNGAIAGQATCKSLLAPKADTENKRACKSAAASSS